MKKLETYIVTLVMCIIIFGFLQAISFLSAIIFQIFSIFILAYGLLGAVLWFNTKKENKDDRS